MANENEQIRELAEAAAQAQRDLANFGRVTQQTQDQITDAQMKAKLGINNFTAGTVKGAEAVGALASAGMAAGKAMLEGKKGAAALNTSLDSLSAAATAAGTALALMIPGGILIKGLVAGITMATTAYIKYTQAANEMADQLHKGYMGLAKAGGAAADGMTGLKQDAQKLGLAMGELDQLVSLVAENSKDFALFAGSVSQGRKQFAAIGEAMTPARQGLLNLGMDIKDINEGTAAYLRTQARTGRAQQMTTDQLAKGAEAYLKEMDGLTKLTGQSRSEMQAQRDRMLQQEQSAAKLRALEMAGNKDGADALKVLGNMLGAAGPKMQSAFNAAITGNLASKDAQEANLASQGELARVVELVQNKQITAAEGAQRVAKAMGQTADTVGTQLGQLGAYENNFGSFYEQQNLRLLAENNFTKTLAQINKDQTNQVAATDPLVAKQTELTLTQIKANQAMTDFIFKGIGPAQEKMIALAKATGSAAEGLSSVVSGERLSAQETAQDDKNWEKFSAMEKVESGLARGIEKLTGIFSTGGETFLARERMKNENAYLKKEGRLEQAVPQAADGGLLSGPQSGYMAMLHGTELVIPEDQLKGKISSGGMAGAGSEQLDKMNELYKEMLKDTQALEKLTDLDLKKTKDFSRLSDKLRTLKTQLMNDEIEMLEDLNDQLASGSGVSMRPTMGAGMLGGGLSMPSMGGMSMPSMGGGQGLQVKNQDDLKGLGLKLKSGDVQAEGAGISPKLIELAKAVQSGVPGFGMFTGFNDKFHNEKAPGSQHTKGLAMDFTVAKPPTREEGRAVTDWLKQMGASLAIDEYNNPSSGATAGHYHAQIPAFKDGGLVDEATLSLIGEGGPEAVIPLKDGNVPVSFNGKMGLGDEAMGLFKVMAEQTANMAAMMEEMVRAQKNSVDVQNKMLRAQS